MGRFFIETQSGQVATGRQLLNAGLIAEGEDSPGLPWHPLSGAADASTMWFAVLRKQTRGIFIGTLVLRHGEHHASLIEQGWEEVDVASIAAPVGQAGEPAWPRGGKT